MRIYSLKYSVAVTKLSIVSRSEGHEISCCMTSVINSSLDEGGFPSASKVAPYSIDNEVGAAPIGRSPN